MAQGRIQQQQQQDSNNKKNSNKNKKKKDERERSLHVDVVKRPREDTNNNNNDYYGNEDGLKKKGRVGSVDTKSNMLDDVSSVYAELRARNQSALAASPGSSLKSINSLSEGEDHHPEGSRDCSVDVLRQVPIMESEAQSKQGSNDPDDTRNKDVLEKSTMGTIYRRQDRVGTRQQKGPKGHHIRMPDPIMMHNTFKAMTPSSMRDSGTYLDMSKAHNHSAGSAAFCYRQQRQHQNTRQGLSSLNKYYIQTQQHHMKTMSNIVNGMAQTAGEMIKQGHNPASLNMSAAIRACSLANIIMYRTRCLGAAGRPPIAVPPPPPPPPPTAVVVGPAVRMPQDGHQSV